MTGRALVFSDDNVIRLINSRFIAVTADDWYQRRRTDIEGQFWKKVADQGPRKGQGGSTRQGIYCFTADGKLLAYRNAQDADVMKQVFQQALREFDKLPEERRKPGAIKIEERGKEDARYTRTLPKNGLIVNVYTRILERKDGEYVKGICERPGGDFTARDRLWLTEAEWQSLIPADPKKGTKLNVPAAIVERITRFHLVDNTRGEPPFWLRSEVRTAKMTLTVEEVTESQVKLKLEGSAVIATNADVKEAVRGYEAGLLGHLHYDRDKKALTRFDVVALGDHWGEGRFTGGARPGRTPLGIVFELSRGDQPSDKVPPQAARELYEYFRK